MIILYVIFFIASCGVLLWAGSRLVKSLMRVGRFLGWREFVVAFFVMAIAGSAPNLFFGINSALHKIPQLSFGEIMGGNVADLTLAVGLAILIGNVALPAGSKMVQISTIFTVVIAVLPLVLIFDGCLGRIDGVILLLAFAVYTFWLFSKEERFKKTYNQKKEGNIIARFFGFLKDVGSILIFLILLLVASEGMVMSARAFSDFLNISLPIVGILIIGLGNALPETYFAIVSARKKQLWMILGDLMGSVIACSTLVLGVVALICPIKIVDFSPYAIARIFLVLSAVFFLIIVRTDKKITRIEGVLLLLIYAVFLAAEIFFS